VVEMTKGGGSGNEHRRGLGNRVQNQSEQKWSVGDVRFVQSLPSCVRPASHVLDLIAHGCYMSVSLWCAGDQDANANGMGIGRPNPSPLLR